MNSRMGECDAVLLDSHSQSSQDASLNQDYLSSVKETPHLNSWMQPVVIDGCFGWLHGSSNMFGDIAVLICPGLGRDTRTAHRSFRLLGDQLASAGYPTLRFEYPGIGDSLDLDGTEQWDAWQLSINRAADWLLAQTGARRVVFCGLRLGAMLATLVASRRSDVAALILLAPVVRGALHIRQHQVEAQLRVASPNTVDGGLELDELRMSPASVKLLSQVDLRQLRLPSGFPVAIFAPTSRSLRDCIKAWSEQGAKINYEDFQPLAAMVRDTYLDEDKQADFASLLTWLPRAVPSRGATASRSFPIPEPGVLTPPGCIELPLRFGRQLGLFGILCRPADVAESDLVVIIVNSGGEPHYGFARFAVELARGIAASGIASLRMDFAGLGDSVRSIENCEVTSHVYNVDRQPDVAAALDVLEQRGYRRFAIHGLCSGAYHAFHSGRRDPRISMLFLVNLPVFAPHVSETIIARSLPYYLSTLVRKKLWMRLAEGQTNPLRIIAGLSTRYGQTTAAALVRAAKHFGWKGQTNFANRSLVAMSRRGVRTQFLFSSGDPGLKSFERHFGPKFVDIAQIPGVSVKIEPGLDHELSTREMRRTVESNTLTFLRSMPAGRLDGIGEGPATAEAVRLSHSRP